MLTKTLVILAVIVAAFLVIVALQPADFTVTRSATIAAPPAIVFEQVNDLHKWQEWSPWAKLDPAAKNSYAGPSTGVGSSFAWAGNGQVGEGSMTITESRPNELVKFRLDFLKPMKGTNLAEFTFKPEGDQTLVTWTLSGTNNFVGKAFSLVLNCNKMIGGFFDQGLASMKAIAEAEAKK